MIPPKERRKYWRIIFRKPVVFSTERIEEGKGLLEDISLNGLCFSTIEKIPVGSSIKLAVDLGLNSVYYLEGRVVHTSKSTPYMYGVKFNIRTFRFLYDNTGFQNFLIGNKIKQDKILRKGAG